MCVYMSHVHTHVGTQAGTHMQAHAHPYISHIHPYILHSHAHTQVHMYTHSYIPHTHIQMCTHSGTNTYAHTYHIQAHTVNATELPSFSSRRQVVECGSRPIREAAWGTRGMACVSCHCGRPHGNLQGWQASFHQPSVKMHVQGPEGQAHLHPLGSNPARAAKSTWEAAPSPHLW